MVITAPGRICLFGEHQDYLGLPVIACALNKKVILTAEATDTAVLQIKMPDIGSERKILLSDSLTSLKQDDYFGSAIRVVKRYRCIPNKGYQITMTSTIPPNAGLSSSSAIVVAWVHFLLKAFQCQEPITPQFIAKLAYEAEVLEHDSPGGRMDQYTSAVGGLIYLQTDADDAFESIETPLNGLVIGESGIGKDTTGVLRNLRFMAETAIYQVTGEVANFNLKTIRKSEIEHYMPYIDKKLRPYFSAAVHNHDITKKAYRAFKQKPLNCKELGRLLFEHHCILRDVLQITVPKIDTLIDVAMQSGAYGAKMVGSGMGGCVVALTSEENKSNVLRAMQRAGAINAYPARITSGTNILA